MYQSVTFIAVSNCIKIHIKIFTAEQDKAQPGIKCINWHNKQDSNYPSLFITAVVVPQMTKNLHKYPNQLQVNFLTL